MSEGDRADREHEAVGEPTDRRATPPDDRAGALRRARKIGGLPGIVVAGAMFGIKDVLDPPKDKESVVVEASSEPVDIDTDGIDIDLDGERRAVSPPLPPLPSHAPRRRRRPHRAR